MNVRARTILSAVFALLAALLSENLFVGVGEWTSSGPDGAVVEALAAHPSNPSTVYAATKTQSPNRTRLSELDERGHSPGARSFFSTFHPEAARISPYRNTSEALARS
jgi:hypothetical protein